MESKEKRFIIHILLVVSLLLIFAARDYLVAIISGLILAYVFFPVYKKLNRKVKNDILSATVTLLLSLVILVIPLIIISSVSVMQASDAIDKIDHMSGQMNLSKDTPIISRINEYIEDPETISYVKTAVKDGLTLLTRSIPSFIGYVSGFILKLFITFVVMFFMLIDGRRSLEVLGSLTPLSKKNKKRLSEKSRSVVRTVLYGQILVALVQGAIGGIGFLIFGVDGAILWGLVMAVLSLFPFIGAFLVWMPVSVYLMVTGELGSGIGLFIYGAIVVGYSDNILRMKILSSIGKIHPLITLFGVLLGLMYFGIMGLIIGPLLLALFICLIRISYDENNRGSGSKNKG